MPTLNTKLFDGREQTLTVYNGQAIIDQAIRFFTVEYCNGEPSEVEFEFNGYNGSYFRAFNQREDKLIVEVTLSQNGAYLILNASVNDMTFEDRGNYYYEIGYVDSVYEQTLMYGTLQVI